MPFATLIDREKLEEISTELPFADALEPTPIPINTANTRQKNAKREPLDLVMVSAFLHDTRHNAALS
ncbi:hypothetical protein [Sinorhizobium medicae]|uniref:hypothetical protein n=1 Tax=Sinorhizobium medicae TaxID=110321 RepID=UPI001F47999A|nr:hypothetical protein [Sinorhizobium medicae]